MKNILKPVFNPKNATSPDSLLFKMKQFDDDPFKSSTEPNYQAITKLITTQDMSKVNPKALHSKLPLIWNWVFSHLKKQQEKDNSLDLSFKNPAPKFLISPKHSEPRKSMTLKQRRSKEERNLKQGEEVKQLSVSTITETDVEWLKSNKDLMAPAAKLVFASYILVNGVTDDAKKIIDNNYEKVWDFTKEQFSIKFVQKIIALQKPAKGSIAQVE